MNNSSSPKISYPPPTHFIDWLDAEKGRAAYFAKVDSGLFPPVITKMKQGLTPITFELAVRLERAQKPSDNPLRAFDLMTFVEHRELYLYVTGKAAAPKPIEQKRRPTSYTRQQRTPALA